jgi:hypothetical protein
MDEQSEPKEGPAVLLFTVGQMLIAAGYRFKGGIGAE